MGHVFASFSGAPLSTRTIATNRDFYIAIACLRQIHRDNQRELGSYLAALKDLAAQHRDDTHISLSTFSNLLRQAFEAPAAEPGESRNQPLANSSDAHTDPYLLWEQTLSEQIADLRAMREAGTVNAAAPAKPAPRNRAWSNTSVPEFLEYGAAGTFGGWDLGDETGVEKIDWHTARKFLVAGQYAE